MRQPLIMPTAEPFYFPGDATACLLIHGFTGTPKEMRWMGEYLARAGHTVLGIRLAGHATHPDDLPRCKWQDWLASVEDGLNLLKGVARRTYVMGLSMGGILSLLAAARYPLAGVVAMSTPYALPPDPRLRYARLIARVMKTIAKGPPDWRDPAAGRDHADYPAYPVAGIAELADLLVEMRAALPAIRVPVLLIHSRADSGVLPENMERIYAALTTADKSMLWVENSSHVITREPDRETVFQAALDFIRRTGGADA